MKLARGKEDQMLLSALIAKDKARLSKWFKSDLACTPKPNKLAIIAKVLVISLVREASAKPVKAEKL